MYLWDWGIRRYGRLQASHSPCDEGLLHLSRPSRHSFVVAVDSEREETWINDPLLQQPAQHLAVNLQRKGFISHSVEKLWMEKVAQNKNCSYLAVKAVSSFIYNRTDDQNIAELGDLFDQKTSMTAQHREEQRSTLEWLQGWGGIKVKLKLRARGQYVPKCSQIVNTADNTVED